MYSRVLTTLVAVWAILLGPTLCVGGWLDHPCAQICHEESDAAQTCCPSHREHQSEGRHENHKGHDGEEEQDGRCAHERACLADPCSQVFRPENESDLASALHAVLPMPVWHEAGILVRPSYSCQYGLDRPPNGHYLAGRPYPDGDLPLLI